jgi:molecular chaperone DnaK (HSP70)
VAAVRFQVFSPEELSAMVLTKMKQTAEVRTVNLSPL